MGIPDEDLRPTWSPPPAVNFDFDLAAKAIRECRDVASQLRDLLDRRKTRGDAVLLHWTGKYRAQWEPSHRQARTSELGMAEHYESLAGRIQGWADAAREAETFRNREVTRWREEYAENRRLATTGSR